MSMLRCSKQLSSTVQRGEQLRACCVIPFPKENYFFGGTGAGERGLVCGKSFCTFWFGLAGGALATAAEEPAEMLQTTAHLQAPLAAYENPNLN